MSRKLPPLNALRAFEAAARHLSFTLAANELNVTPAAVSHQVKALEDWLGAKLFLRLTRALQLTDEGKSALPELTRGFDLLADGTNRLLAMKDEDLLTISVSPSFAALWLMPKLDDFQRQHTDIEIRIDGTDRIVDVANGEADCAIRYGPGGYKGVRVDTLFRQANTPVCAPCLLNGDLSLQKPDDLINHTLLHVDWRDSEASWPMWLQAAGVSAIDGTRGPRFTQEEMAVQAALDGKGVALIGDKIIADHLSKNLLVRPFDPVFSTPLSFAFHLLTSRAKQQPEKVKKFRAWLLNEVGRNALESES